MNGLDLYDEIHGDGEPLILLHGGVGAIEIFGEVLPLLAEGRRVIAVDLQAHGRTADIDRPMTFEAMADDVAALIEHLGLGEADVMGYSLGGGKQDAGWDGSGMLLLSSDGCRRRALPGLIRAIRKARRESRMGGTMTGGRHRPKPAIYNG